MQKPPRVNRYASKESCSFKRDKLKKKNEKNNNNNQQMDKENSVIENE